MADSLGERFRRWLETEIIGDVPEDLIMCEYECGKRECSEGEWEICERRRSQGEGELMPRRPMPWVVKG